MKYHIELYVSHITPIVKAAIASIRASLEAADDNYKLDVIEVLKEPERSFEAQITATPTIIRRLPEPVINTLSELESDEVLKIIIFKET